MNFRDEHAAIYTETLSYPMSTFHSVIGSGNETQLKELVK